MTQASTSAPALGDADSLKSRFKGRCTETKNVHQNWQIRVHRSLSWSKRAAAFADNQPEAAFLYLWIALNSLYSRWNPERNAPHLDTPSREAFIERVCGWDSPLIGSVLQTHRGLIKKILGNAYLSDTFWRDPEHPKSKGWATEDANYLDRNLKNHDYCRVLSQALHRLFVLRGQIVHGASSGGSRLNRSSLSYSLQLLSIVVPVTQVIVIDRGCGDDWPDLCYPPRV